MDKGPRYVVRRRASVRFSRRSKAVLYLLVEGSYSKWVLNRHEAYKSALVQKLVRASSQLRESGSCLFSVYP